MTALFMALVALVLGVLAVSADTTEVVNPADLSTTFGATDWHIAFTAGAATSGIVTGPAAPPLGTGSLEMTTGAAADKRYIMNYDHVGVELADITALGYSTYGNSTTLAVVLQLQIDPDGAGPGVPRLGGGAPVNFATLNFEPYHANAVLSGSWQTWDALTDGASVWASNVEGDSGNANNGTQGNPATWAEFVAFYPDAVISGGFGVNVGSGWATPFTGNTDALQIGYAGSTTTYDFDPAVPCTTVCYADAVNGNDLNGGASAGDAKKTIQAAIDQVDAGGQVRVLPGDYDETATNRFVLGVNGPHQFGLFIEDDTKDGISIIGVTAADVAITDPTATEAKITTNATNNFGTSGIFVEADDVTITGLEIGPNTPGENKTIEIIGDNFALTNSFLSGDGVDGASIYFGDWRYDQVNDISYITEYTIDNNLFGAGSIITIASGTGVTGPESGRVISNNDFTNGTGQTWPSISFRGAGGQPWYVDPVGGATITGNTFNNDNYGALQWIRATGDYIEAQFDWASFWNDNTYDNATVTYETSLADPRTFTDGTYPNIRRIGAQIQTEINTVAQPGDTVLVNEGTYPESPTINKSLTLLSDDGRDVTFIELQTGTNYLHSMEISGADVTVDGFTIVGIDANCPTDLASSNIYVTLTPDNVVIKNNRFRVGAIGACTNFDDGFGIITTYSGNPDVATVLVEDNIFEPLNTSGQRAYYINPSVVSFTFRGNEINGQFDGNAASEAQNNLIENNTINGTGTSGGFVLAGYVDPTVWGHGTIQGNTISNTVNGISIVDTQEVTVTKNFLNRNDRAVRVLFVFNPNFDESTIHINRNSITESDTLGIDNQLDQTEYGDIDGTCNWWGALDGPGPVGSGSGDNVSADVVFTPWLYTEDLDGPCYVGGTITIVKSAPDGGDTEFEFDPSWSDEENILLKDGESHTTVPPLKPGVYSVSEVNLPLGWSLDSAECVNQNDATADPGQIPVEDNDNWVCTFNNVYTPPPPGEVCVAESNFVGLTTTTILGKGLFPNQEVRVNIPNSAEASNLYAQLAGKKEPFNTYTSAVFRPLQGTTPLATYNIPGASVTSKEWRTWAVFWFGQDLSAWDGTATAVRGRLNASTSNPPPIPMGRALIVYADYPTKDEAEYWNYTAQLDVSLENHVYWGAGWIPEQTYVVDLDAALSEARDIAIQAAVVDNDADTRPFYLTVTALDTNGDPLGTPLFFNPTGPSLSGGPGNAQILNLIKGTLEAPAGTAAIEFHLESPRTIGESAALVGVNVNYACEVDEP